MVDMDPGQQVGGAAWLGGCHALTPLKLGSAQGRRRQPLALHEPTLPYLPTTRGTSLYLW